KYCPKSGYPALTDCCCKVRNCCVVRNPAFPYSPQTAFTWTVSRFSFFYHTTKPFENLPFGQKKKEETDQTASISSPPIHIRFKCSASSSSKRSALSPGLIEPVTPSMPSCRAGFPLAIRLASAIGRPTC